MTEIVVVARLQYAVGGELFTVGVSDGPYIDAGNATGLVGGCYYPLIDAEFDPRLAERARHAFHDQPSPLEIPDLRLVNTSGFFDAWAGYQVRGFRCEIRCGLASDAWEDLEPRLVARQIGIEFDGRAAMVLRLGNVLSPLQAPFNQVVFDESVANPRLANTQVPAVLGRALQVRGLEVDPAQLRYTGAWNLSFAAQVAEGGNPTDNFFRIDKGWQLTQAPLDNFVITANIAGPPVAPEEEVDLLGGDGDFTTAVDLSAWTVEEDDPAGTVALQSSPDGLAVDIDHTAFSFAPTGTCTAVTVEPASLNSQSGFTLDTNTGSWSWFDSAGLIISPPPVDPSGLLELDDDASLEVRFNDVNQRWSRGFTLRGFDLGIDPGARISSIEVDFRVRRVAGSLATYLERAQLVHPDGSVGPSILPQTNSQAPDGELIFTTEHVITLGGDDTWGLNLTAGDLASADFGLRFWIRREPVVGSVVGGMFPTDTRVYQVVLKATLADTGNVVRMYYDAGMEAGKTYQLRVNHAQDPGSVLLRWAGVGASGDAVSGVGDVFSRFEATLTDAGELKAEFMADGSWLALGFATLAGQTADQLIETVELVEAGRARDRYAELVPYIVEQMGVDPELNVAQSEIDAHDTITGTMPLGWLVNGSETGDDLLFLLASSLGGAVYHGLDGKVHSFLVQDPAGVDDTRPEVGPERIDVDQCRAWDDDPPGITDRVQAARNWHPIPEDRTANITSTWTAQDRADVIAPWRITKRARFGNLLGFIQPDAGLTVSAISPTSGTDAGGTTVTITGTGFEAGATVTIGGASATSVVVDSATQIICDTPAGTAGNADVVVTVGAESATLTDGFEFTASVVYADLDAAATGASLTIRPDGRTAANDTTNNSLSQSSLAEGAKSSGKYYFELVVDSSVSSAVGIAKSSFSFGSQWIGNTGDSYGHWNNGLWNAGSNQDETKNFAANDVIMIAVDFDAGLLWFGKNGTWYDSGDPAAGTNEQFSGLSGSYLPAVTPWSRNRELTLVSDPADFSHTVPSGFTAGWPA